MATTTLPETPARTTPRRRRAVRTGGVVAALLLPNEQLSAGDE